MTQEFHPDIYWMRRALLMALLTHPYVKAANITYPPLDGTQPEKVTIQRGRLFGGPELIEPGLTLAVYPYHSSYDPMEGIPPDTLHSEKTMLFPVFNEKREHFTTLGAHRGPREHGQHAIVKFMVQLYYRDTVYDAPASIQADYIDQEDIIEENYFGYHFQYSTDTPKESTELQDTTRKFVKQNKVEVQILPGEEILTQWLDVIKFAARDIKVLRPYTTIRNAHVLCADFPTATWTSKSANLIFHSAYLVVQYDIVEPAIPPFIHLPLTQSIDLQVTQ